MTEPAGAPVKVTVTHAPKCTPTKNGRVCESGTGGTTVTMTGPANNSHVDNAAGKKQAPSRVASSSPAAEDPPHADPCKDAGLPPGSYLSQNYTDMPNDPYAPKYIRILVPRGNGANPAGQADNEYKNVQDAARYSVKESDRGKVVNANITGPSSKFQRMNGTWYAVYYYTQPSRVDTTH
ncbi:MAG: hypothetical protein WC624_06290 [Candidatus Margulisiibacteriota bacterium]